jgi:hypothetical protein
MDSHYYCFLEIKGHFKDPLDNTKTSGQEEAGVTEHFL